MDENKINCEQAPDACEATEKKEPKAKSKKQSGKEAALLSEIEALKKSAEEQKDTYLRLCAEYDNFRKRSAKEKSESYSNAVAKTVSELLPVLDNLERAVGASGEGADAGYSMIYTQFCELLEKLGIKEIAAAGEAFNPNLHIAVMHVDDESLPENSVAEVFQKGYVLGDKVVRPACVKVAN